MNVELRRRSREERRAYLQGYLAGISKVSHALADISDDITKVAKELKTETELMASMWERGLDE